MILADTLQLSFGTQTVFDDISFTIQPNQRIGLVGRNGSGKSTLLEVIAGTQEVDDGRVSIGRHTKVAYMPQEVVLNSTRCILDETMTAFASLELIQEEIKKIEQLLTTTSEIDSAPLVDRYAHLQEELTALNPAHLQAQTKKMLNGLGFKNEQFDQAVNTLSVGWKMRIVLAKLLLQNADFYLFDEPTNHLDIVAKDWFITFLKEAPFGFLLVCHERHFLDALVTNIFELERGKGTMYSGGYTTYEKQKAHDLELLESAYQLQQKEIERKQANIDRFRASASRAKMAQSMMKSLEKIERITLPPTLRTVSFRFPPVTPSGRIVLKIENLTFGFNGTPLFTALNAEIERGEKVALIAANGVGKTTLFNVLADKYKPTVGKINFGHNVQIALFDQDQQAALQLDKTVLQNINNACPRIPEQTIRTFLGSFLFGSEEISKKVDVLSGGEKNRVGMVRTLLQHANFLLLDEPTNHLDIPSKELLLKALAAYEGTILFVSHDQSFVNTLATRILELTPQGLRSYPGNYESYRYQKQTEPLSAPENSTDTTMVDKKDKSPQTAQHTLPKKSSVLERKIDHIEKELTKTRNDFAELTYGTPAYEMAEKKLNLLASEYEQLMCEWEKIQHNL